METEHEVKVLKIDPVVIRQQLLDLGASHDPEKLQRRYVFNLPTGMNTWVRLRDEGDRVTLTYKNKAGDGVSETKEIEVLVSDFEKTAQIMKTIGFIDFLYQETKRETFLLNGVQYTIDSWPLLEPFLEVEADSEEAVLKGVELLGFSEHDGNGSIHELYAAQGHDLYEIKELKF